MARGTPPASGAVAPLTILSEPKYAGPIHGIRHSGRSQIVKRTASAQVSRYYLLGYGICDKPVEQTALPADLPGESIKTFALLTFNSIRQVYDCLGKVQLNVCRVEGSLCTTTKCLFDISENFLKPGRARLPPQDLAGSSVNPPVVFRAHPMVERLRSLLRNLDLRAPATSDAENSDRQSPPETNERTHVFGH